MINYIETPTNFYSNYIEHNNFKHIERYKGDKHER